MDGVELFHVDTNMPAFVLLGSRLLQKGQAPA